MSLKDIFESETFLQALMIISLPVALIIIYAFIKGLTVNKKNEKRPVEAKQATVVSKRYISNTNPYAGSLILFEFNDGSRQEYPINANAASVIAENDTGMLIYQGAKFINFERNKSN